MSVDTEKGHRVAVLISSPLSPIATNSGKQKGFLIKLRMRRSFV